MPNDYAPRQFFRHVQIALLREYFSQREALNDVAWGSLEEAKIEPIFEAWDALPEQTRTGFESEFRRIHAMGSPDGTRAILEEGRYHGIDLAGDLDAMVGHINKAFWTFIDHNRVFYVAEKLNRADHLNRRSWRKRKDLPKKDPDVSSNALEELAKAISAYYWEREGRGRLCHRADPYLKANRYHYIFVYPKDYSDTFVGYRDDGEFERRPQAPAFEIIYVFDSQDGTLDLYVRGDKNIVRDLQELFGRTILHEELGEVKPGSDPYKLNALKHRDFSFPTEPGDRVKGVKVTAMRLSLVGNPRKRITFEIGPKDPKESIYDFMDTALHEQRLPLSMVDVSSAVIQMTFENANGRRRDERTLSFRIGHPNTCTLKGSPDELLAKKYLREWKIETA